jgi:hypothetical protein
MKPAMDELGVFSALRVCVIIVVAGFYSVAEQRTMRAR